MRDKSSLKHWNERKGRFCIQIVIVQEPTKWQATLKFLLIRKRESDGSRKRR